MKNKFNQTISIVITLLAILTFIPTVSIAQTSQSTGRSAGTVETFNNNEYEAIKRIRDHINKGEYERAESRSTRIIRAEDRNSRSGMSKTGLYREAYNALCVSLAGQQKNEEAMTACDTSIDLSPTHWESLKTRATLYYMVQDFPKSLADFELSLENAPENEDLTNVLKQNIAVVRSKIN